VGIVARTGKSVLLERAYTWKELFPVDWGLFWYREKCTSGKGVYSTVYMKGTILCLKRICNPVHIGNNCTLGKGVHLKGSIQIIEEMFH
jgi:hypothetical protein